MSLTDLPASSDAGTMTNDQHSPRSDRPRRRTFSAAYKLRILDAYEKATGTGPAPKTSADKETERLTKENERLKAELDKTRKSLQILGKAHELLELLSESSDSANKPEK